MLCENILLVIMMSVRDYVTAMNWIGFTPDKMHLLFVDMPTETHKNYVYE